MTSDEVCVVLNPKAASKFNYYVYLINPHEKDCSIVRRNATIRFNGPHSAMAFVVINSTLYMFGGFVNSFIWTRKSYSIDLRPYRSTTESSQTKDFNSINAMKYYKVNPRAVSIGDQICVFSICLQPDSENFELYDPKRNEWLSVPEPPIVFSDSKPCKVGFYGVENGSCFFICTSDGSFSIDFSKPWETRKWTSYHLALPYEKTLNYRNVQPYLKDNELLFSPNSEVFDLKSAKRGEQEKVLYARDKAVLMLPKKKDMKNLMACVVETGGFELYEPLLVQLPVIRLSLFEFEDDKLENSPFLLNSLSFYLHAGIKSYDIDIVGVFHM